MLLVADIHFWQIHDNFSYLLWWGVLPPLDISTDSWRTTMI
jgi:hypothetical protein